MVGPRKHARALAAACGVLGLALLGSAPAPTAGAAGPVPSAPSAPSPEPGDGFGTVDPGVPDGGSQTTPDPEDAEPDPLAVTIDDLSPGSLPASGPIRVTGTVTNRTDEDWSSIRLFALVGDGSDFAPLRSPDELAAAADTEPDDLVGYRKTEVGSPGEVELLPAGATARYSIELPAESVVTTTPGSYWFGVHALGSSASEPDDGNAVGRARTFLPWVPRRYDDTPLPTAVVLPLTQPVRYAADGSVDDVATWTRVLGPTGRLTRLLELGAASPAPLTWVVDPAVVDAVAHLARGNRGRDLGPTGSGTGTPGPDETGSPSEGAPDAGDEAGDEAGDGAGDGDAEAPGEGAGEPQEESAVAASAWLDRLRQVLPGNQVLTLPYGNVDVPALLEHQPRLLELALAQRSAVLGDITPTEPVMTSPSGYLDAAAIRAASPETRLLVTDRMLGPDAPAVVDADGHRVDVTSSGVADGGPGPGAPLTSVAIRQRFLAEAAVRAIDPDRPPLVAVLPVGWSLADPGTFWAALDVPWLDLGTLAEAEAASTPGAQPVAVDPDDLTYTETQEALQLDEPLVDEVDGLVRAGDTLQNLLVDNTGIGGTITEEALTGLSYAVRKTQGYGRLVTDRSRRWVDERLADVTVTSSPGITLAGETGSFQATLTNDLDQRVTVGVRAVSDDGITFTVPEPVVLAPGSRQSIRIGARTTSNTVHRVRLEAVAVDGTPLGSTDDLPVRSTQVSGVIWLILGTGGGLLFLAIAVRLVRRVQAARRGEAGAGRRTTAGAGGSAAEGRPSFEAG
ncbi:DUF6049 family protein [Nocardioides litoris]|uniref:DUF6049 family protein n=1 Tax=Nocardioides litoris TaxID=1926648 RepID=UPI0011232382|nr:DUF6049 family protein [Nocardioides litoris]